MIGASLGAAKLRKYKNGVTRRPGDKPISPASPSSLRLRPASRARL